MKINLRAEVWDSQTSVPPIFFIIFLKLYHKLSIQIKLVSKF